MLEDRGPAICASAEAYPRAAVDAALLRVVRDELLSPAALADLHAELRALMAERRKAGGQDAARTRLQALQAEIGRLVDAVARVGPVDALAARLQAAEAERRALEARATAGADAPPVSVEAVVAAYRRQLLQLQQALQDDADRDRTRALLADLLGEVRLVRDDDGLWAEMDEPAARVALAGSPLTLVAGARNGGCRRVRIR